MIASSQPSAQPEVLASQINQQLQSGQAVDLSTIPSVDRLVLRNEVLKLNSLRALEGIGNKADGQIEIVGINAISPDPVKPGAFVTRVDFQCNLPKPGGFNHLSFFNAGTTEHSGVVILPIVNNEYLLMVQQFRPVIGKNTIEVPRGFVADLGDPNAIKSYGSALIELAQETGVELEHIKHEVSKNFRLYENTGTSNISNAVLVINFELSPQEVRSLMSRVISDEDNLEHSIKTLLIPLNEVKRFANDNHTAAALFKGLP